MLSLLNGNLSGSRILSWQLFSSVLWRQCFFVFWHLLLQMKSLLTVYLLLLKLICTFFLIVFLWCSAVVFSPHGETRISLYYLWQLVTHLNGDSSFLSAETFVVHVSSNMSSSHSIIWTPLRCMLDLLNLYLYVSLLLTSHLYFSFTHYGSIRSFSLLKVIKTYLISAKFILLKFNYLFISKSLTWDILKVAFLPPHRMFI